VAWIKCDVLIRENKKIRKLCGLTGWNTYECIGRMVALWAWCLKNQEDGYLSGMDPLEYLDDIKGDLSAPALEEYLMQCGLVDRRPKRIHDWLQFADRYLIRKYQNNHIQILQEIWQKHGEVYGERKR